MYQNGQRDATRPFHVPPPPPPMSPPPSVGIGNLMAIPPPPPRYPNAPGTAASTLLPPPPGPPPSSTSFPSSTVQPPSALGSAPWHGNWGRAYDGRTAFNIPPPPPPSGGGAPVLQAYNPKLHAQAVAAANAATSSGPTLTVPPPPPPSEQMSATYIPQGDTYGEGVGIPGLGLADDGGHGWGGGGHVESATATPLDETSGRDRLYVAAMNQKGSSNATNSSAALSSIPPELAAQWTIDMVIAWLQANDFSAEWQETFKVLNICGAQFLSLGSSHGGRGNFGMMHQQVYPQLMRILGDRWDQPREREEGKRMRRLIRSIVTGKPVNPSKVSSGHARKESAAVGVAPSTAAESGETPNVSLQPRPPNFSVWPNTKRETGANVCGPARPLSRDPAPAWAGAGFLSHGRRPCRQLLTAP